MLWGILVGAELKKLRLDDIKAMRALCPKAEESEEGVSVETEHLRENEKAVKIQENKVLSSSEQIEQKQAEFQAKVLAVHEEDLSEAIHLGVIQLSQRTVAV